MLNRILFADDGAHVFSRHSPVNVFRIFDAEEKYGQIVVVGHGSGSGIDNAEMILQNGVEGNAVVFDGVVKFPGIFIVYAVDILGKQSNIGIRFNRPKDRGGIGGTEGIAGAAAEYHHTALLQMMDCLQTDIGFRELTHFNGCLHADLQPVLLQNVGKGKRVDGCAQHAHVVRTGTVYLSRSVAHAPPDVARADHDADLHARIHAALDNIGQIVEYIEVKAGALCAGKRFTADFDQNAPVFLFCHLMHLKCLYFRTDRRKKDQHAQTSSFPYFTANRAVCIGGLYKLFYKNSVVKKRRRDAAKKTILFRRTERNIVLPAPCIECGEFQIQEVAMSFACFLGANTPNGFVSHFTGMTDRVSRLYIIKGGPGCGKSTAMKRIAGACEEAGMNVERIWCSSDTDSLDGILLPELDVMYVDGTAPHTLEPGCPGARDGILDFGAFWDERILTENRREIEAAAGAVSDCYRRAYHYLSAVGELTALRAGEAVRTADRERLFRRARRIAARYIPSRRGRTRGKRIDIFLSTLTPTGPLFLDSFSDWEVCELYDEDGIFPLVTEPVLEAALVSGFTVYAAYDPLLCSAGPRHLVIPALRFALLTSGGIFGCPAAGRRRVRLDRLTDNGALHAGSARRKQDDICCRSLLEGAMRSLEEAKRQHDRLESLYRPAVDFRAVDELTARHCDMLCRRFREYAGQVQKS